MRAVLVGRLRELATRPHDAEPAAVFLATEDARALYEHHVTGEWLGVQLERLKRHWMDAAKPAEASE